jgi:adenylate cyclase class 2
MRFVNNASVRLWRCDYYDTLGILATCSQGSPRRRRSRGRSARDYTLNMPAHRRATHLEIEVKIPIREPVQEIIRRLHRLGASCFGRVLEQNTLFDTRHSHFRRCGRLLRLRVQTPAPLRKQKGGMRQAVLTCKAPAAEPAKRPRGGGRSGAFKEKAERELPIRSPGRWPSILRSLGFVPRFRYEKFRTSFHLGQLHLDLDETPVGVFLELEGRRQDIDRAARALGFSRRLYLHATYWDLYAARCRSLGRIPRNMLFHR